MSCVMYCIPENPVYTPSELLNQLVVFQELDNLVNEIYEIKTTYILEKKCLKKCRSFTKMP